MKLYLASHFHLLQAKSEFKKLGAIRMALIKTDSAVKLSVKSRLPKTAGVLGQACEDNLDSSA